MKMKKLLLIVFGLIVLAGGSFLTVYLLSVHNYKAEVANMNITDINLSSIPDGTYLGECDVDFIYAKVSVTIKEGLITDIKLLEHKNGKGAPAEVIIKDIIAKQTLEVDAVSGATNSSKVIKKAIENALSGTN